MKRTATAADVAERGLLGSALFALAALVVGLVVSAPAQAAGMSSGPMIGAEKLRRLDIMLMVTGLRCRTSADNFVADYGSFTENHLSELNAANAELKAQFIRSHGVAGAQRALDRLSTVMANGYGQGHPWLSCGDLKVVARNLAQARGRATLEEAADQLLADNSVTRLAWAQR
jgi:hypothetical protein